MKRIFLMLTVILTVLTTAGHTIDSLIEEFRNEKHATFVSIPESAMALTKVFANDTTDNLATASSMKVLTIDKCSRGAKKKIIKAFKECDFDGYEPIVSVEQKNDNTAILAKADDEYITEIVILAVKGKNVSIIKICGQFSPDKIGSVVDSAEKKL